MVFLKIYVNTKGIICRNRNFINNDNKVVVLKYLANIINIRPTFKNSQNRNKVKTLIWRLPLGAKPTREAELVLK